MAVRDWTWKDWGIAALAVVGGLKVVELVKGIVLPRVNEDDIEFIEQRGGSWQITDARTGYLLGQLEEDDDGFGVHLDYAPSIPASHIVVEREFGVEKNLDAAKDVVVEYLRDVGLLEE